MIGAGRLYVVEFHNVSATVQQDFFYIKPAADKICIIELVKIAAAGGTADAGDAQEELWDIECLYLPATVTASSGGNSFTPVPKLVNDTAAGFTARINDTTKATSSGTAVNRDSDGMNNRIPYIWNPNPEHRDIVANAAAFVCRLNTTPNDAILLNGTMLVREMP
jgi:hypothetical protein